MSSDQKREINTLVGLNEIEPSGSIHDYAYDYDETYNEISDNHVRAPDVTYNDTLLQNNYFEPEKPNDITQDEWDQILESSAFEEEKRIKNAENELKVNQKIRESNYKFNNEEAKRKADNLIRKEYKINENLFISRKRESEFGKILNDFNRVKSRLGSTTKDIADKNIFNYFIELISTYIKDPQIEEIIISENDFENLSYLLEQTSLKRFLNDDEKEKIINIFTVHFDENEYTYTEED